MARKSTGKRTRFEVFKRDYFTCQYCGAQPPAVVLVADHITPVAAGGDDSMANLITACEPCNQGKAAQLLTARQIRPDADLMYLEAQQEIAELKRFQAAATEREEVLKEVVQILVRSWYNTGGASLDWHPAEHVLLQMLRNYPPDQVQECLEDLAVKVAGDYSRLGRGERWLPYLWGMLRHHADERREG